MRLPAQHLPALWTRQFALVRHMDPRDVRLECVLVGMDVRTVRTLQVQLLLADVQVPRQSPHRLPTLSARGPVRFRVVEGLVVVREVALRREGLFADAAKERLLHRRVPRLDVDRQLGGVVAFELALAATNRSLVRGYVL